MKISWCLSQLLEILSKTHEPPIILSLTPHSELSAGAEAPADSPPTVSIEVQAVSPSKAADSDAAAAAAFDRRLPRLLCCSCLCCTLIAFVLVGVAGANSIL